MKKTLVAFLILLSSVAIGQTYNGYSFISTNNSSTATLGGGAAFTGTGDEVKNYASATVYVFTDVISATDGLSIQQSNDNTNWDVRDLYTVPAMAAGAGKTYAMQITARYFRIVYTNGAGAQASFRLQVMYHTYEQPTSSIRPSDAYSNENDFRTELGFLMGYNGSTWDRLRTTGTGNLATDISKINAVTPLMGNGVTGTGSLRVTVASDNTPFSVNASSTLQTGSAQIGHLEANQSVNVAQINGVTTLMGNGTTGTGSQRVTISSDNTAFSVNPLSATAPVVTMNSASANSGLNSATAFVFDDASPTSITENSFGFGRMSANRNQYVTLRDAAGNERGLNIDANNAIAATVTNATAANLNATVVIATGSAQIGHLEANQSVNVAQINGVTPLMGNGVTGTGSHRVTLVSDGTAISTVGYMSVKFDQTTDGTTNKVAATQSTSSNLKDEPNGNVAHDAGDAGNPIKIGAKAETSPKGITVVADGDRTDLYADADGMLMVKLNTSVADIISENVTNTNGTSTAFTNFSAVASTKNVVTTIVVYNSSATAGTVDFRDGTGGSVLWTMPLPAGGGAVLSSAAGLFKTTANTALAFDVSGALSTVTISVSGFQSKL